MIMRRRLNEFPPAGWKMYHFHARVVPFGDK